MSNQFLYCFFYTLICTSSFFFQVSKRKFVSSQSSWSFLNAYFPSFLSAAKFKFPVELELNTCMIASRLLVQNCPPFNSAVWILWRKSHQSLIPNLDGNEREWSYYWPAVSQVVLHFSPRIDVGRPECHSTDFTLASPDSQKYATPSSN